jgi:2-oxo-4-hydroxy-4-carboxy-5-ureidoimidazoline decarboxylase
MVIHKKTLQEINSLDRDPFVLALEGLFEGPPWIVSRSWSKRPFGSLDQFYQALCDVMYQGDQERQIALLRAHPDLVGRAALAGTLSPASTNEQAAAGLSQLTSEEIVIFQRSNQAYQAKFDFPFVICARQNKKESILAGFAERLPHTREQEIEIALGEVAKICALRLPDLIEETETSPSTPALHTE